MTECITLNVQQSSGGGTGETGDGGSPEVNTLSAPTSSNSGEEFEVSYKVCCNGGTCPYDITLYVNSEEVYTEGMELSSECSSGTIGVTVEGNGQHTITLEYGDRAMDRTIEIIGDDSGDDNGELFPDLPGGDGGSTPDTEPELPLGLTKNQALAIGGGALGIVALSSGSGRPRPIRYIRGDRNA